MAADPDDLLARFGGTTVNDMNNVLNINDEADPDDDISTLLLTRYFETNELERYLKDHKHQFTLLSLNVQIIRAKFDQLSVILCTLYNGGLSFSTICFKETWLAENDDVTPFLLPGYS